MGSEIKPLKLGLFRDNQQVAELNFQKPFLIKIQSLKV